MAEISGEAFEFQSEVVRPEHRLRLIAKGVLGVVRDDGGIAMADNRGVVGGAGLDRESWLRLAEAGEVDPSLIPSDVSLKTTIERGGEKA